MKNNNLDFKLMLDIPMEHGGLTESGDLTPAFDKEENDRVRLFARSSHLIMLCDEEKPEIEYSGVGRVYIYTYDEDFNFLDMREAGSSKNEISKNARYIKLAISAEENIDLSKKLTLITKSGAALCKNKRSEGKFISFLYNFHGDNFTSGKLVLPLEYDPFGKPVPIIIFAHGSGDYSSMCDPLLTRRYDKYLEFLRDEGFSIFDCHGWGTVYGSDGSQSNTWGAPTNMDAFVSGLKFVTERWNIDAENVFTSCKSLGGIVAAALAFRDDISIKAAGLLAPELDILVPFPFAYSRPGRRNLARDLGFAEGWEEILDKEREAFIEEENRKAARALFEKNCECFASYDPTWFGIEAPASEKIYWSLKHNYPTDTPRYCKTPFKIWMSKDDSAVSWSQSNSFIETLKAAGSHSEMRTLPNETGKHHSVDDDPAAPKVDRITAANGREHEDIALAYVELSEFFKSFMA